MFDLENPVMRLCAEGMQHDGEPEVASRLFMQAWEARKDDFDAAVAAHYVARHQPTPQETLEWNETALRHAEQVVDGRAGALLPSLLLNLGESYRIAGGHRHAEALARRGLGVLDGMPEGDGYNAFVRGGLERLLDQVRGRPTSG